MDTKIYEEIAKRGIITEREINLIKNRKNRGKGSGSMSIMNYGPLQITPEQTEKGLKWLLNLYQTPTGKVRKRNPFKPWQIGILKHFHKFEFVGFYNIGFWSAHFVPAYRVWGKHGKPFLYIPSYNNHKQPITFLD